MLYEVRRSLNIMIGIKNACDVFGLSVPHFLAISIVGMMKGELLHRRRNRGGRVGYSPPKNLLPEHTRNEVLYDSYTDE